MFKNEHSIPGSEKFNAPDDVTVKGWIKKDLEASMALLHVILNDAVLLDKVAEIVIQRARDTKPLIDSMPVTKGKEVKDARVSG